MARSATKRLVSNGWSIKPSKIFLYIKSPGQYLSSMVINGMAIIS
jgi:hypothetical protein